MWTSRLGCLYVRVVEAQLGDCSKDVTPNRRLQPPVIQAGIAWWARVIERLRIAIPIACRGLQTNDANPDFFSSPLEPSHPRNLCGKGASPEREGVFSHLLQAGDVHLYLRLLTAAWSESPKLHPLHGSPEDHLRKHPSDVSQWIGVWSSMPAVENIDSTYFGTCIPIRVPAMSTVAPDDPHDHAKPSPTHQPICTSPSDRLSEP